MTKIPIFLLLSATVLLRTSAVTIQQDPAKLAENAISDSLEKTRQAVEFVSNLSKQGGSDPKTASALHGCVGHFKDAVDMITDSLKQFREAVPPGSEQFDFQMSNVNTWMGTAEINAGDCKDEFEDIAAGEIKSKVIGKADEVTKATQNALELVNSYAGKGL